ncbi:hypothetical protein A6J40_01900 [Legionella longbeachae]|uniref:hypothetical protein n=1 Tax=Legionella longbeachae TaxID=450 RepID=UPI0009B79E95|nr:hypothetical protein [Legionella longbeachae]VEE02723.1 Uncharacterised protein [Legionella oakridgensis]ARB91014.1 hypothetical protein A6J40_01900 [Legionella longbeachae]ARM32559.1 hypothetical protein B0B39_03015 [Legionella longbeachae]RZV21194.1 hypothetical protein EKG34_17240 [Legionella longbeachae]UAK45785.1 hypothetical protein K8O86_13460 [Legionella longbeachae]
MNKIEQVSWDEIKHKIKAVNPSIYHVMEQIAPINTPFFLAHYEFGEHFGIRNFAYLPTSSGKLEKIESKHTDPVLFQHLGYGKNSLPLGMIMDKYCEWHYFGENERIFPDCVQGPGAIFNMQIVFDEDKTVANNVLSVSSGALSSFMLPSIGCSRKHGRILKYFNVSLPAPKSPYEHYLVFKELLQDKSNKINWHSQILYFSEEFIKEVKHNEKWLKLKLYFSESLRKKLTRSTYDASCNDLFLSAKKINRFRPTPFIMDTAKYIFNICMGSGIGVKPAVDEQYLPAHNLQKIYNECYGLEYTPTLMVPASLNQPNDTIYYPLLCPFSKINTFKTNQSNSTLTELEILKNVLLAYQEEFTDEEGDACGSSLYQVSKNIQFSFYHYKATGSNKIKNSTEIVDSDQRFSFSYCAENNKFASDAKLFRGCVQLSR